MEKILRISLKLNFTPNTLGGYGLNVIFSRNGEEKGDNNKFPRRDKEGRYSASDEVDAMKPGRKKSLTFFPS